MKNETNTIKKTFPVTGMSCAGCAISVDKALKATEGVQNAEVNFATHTAWADYDPMKVSLKTLQTALQNAGYDAIIEEDHVEERQEQAKREYVDRIKNALLGSAILALPVFVLGMFFNGWKLGQFISIPLSAIVIFYFGRDFFVGAWKQLRNGSANMDTLVVLSTSIAFLLSVFNTFFATFWLNRGLESHVYYEAAVLIITFILLGRYLEEKAKSNTSTALQKLMGLQPKTVTVIRNSIEKLIPIDEVQVGDEIKVKPGEKIPVDGMLVSGNSFIDESMITGEPIPVEKTSDSEVFAGTINQKGSFNFVAEKVGTDTLLASIIKSVKEAQGSRAPVQNLVDKIAAIFVPTVIGIAVVTFVLWQIYGGENALTQGLLSAITVLVIACPCALGLATPTAIIVGIGKGAENNLLIRDAESLEKAYKTQVMVLDKTGTITEGKPSVVANEWFVDQKSLAAVLFEIESRSEHPLANSIKASLSLENQELAAVDCENFQSHTGRGVSASIASNTYYVGNRKLMEENGIQLKKEELERSLAWEKEGKTVVYFADQEQLIAIFAISDTVKKDVKESISELKKRGITFYLLSGDTEDSARTVAEEVGIGHYKGAMLPHEKADYIRKLQSEGKIVAMVGDGINDSEALAVSDVSIAMGKGSDIAIDVAKMTLIGSDFKNLPKAFRLSELTIRGIKQNLFWAFIYNIIGIPLAAGLLYPFTGYLLNPMIAGAAMAFSSVSVVLNSLRLKRMRI